MSRPFAVIGFSMLFSLIMLFFLPEWFIYPALGVFALGLVIALVLRRKTAITAMASGLLAALALLAQLNVVYYPALEHVGENVQVRAVVISNPEGRFGRYVYQLRAMSIDGQPVNLRLRFTSHVPTYARPYDEIEFTGNVFMLGAEDPEAAQIHKARGVYLGSFARRAGEDTQLEVIPRQSLHPMRPILQLQRWMQNRLQVLYPGESSAIFRAMLLGDQTGISWPTTMDFRITGKWHIFSVSGLHMSILAWTMFKGLLALQLNRRAAVVASATFVLFFMALTGFTASCVRAGIMMLIILAGELFSRRADALNSMGLAAIILCLISPLSAGQIGLQLSFGATLGIVMFANRFAKPLHEKLKFPKLLAEPLGVTMAALALTLPVTLLRLPSGTSLLTFPANMLLTPFVGPAMILSGITMFIPWPPLIWLTEQLANLLFWTTNRLAGISAPKLYGDLQSLTVPLAICALIAAAALVLRYFGRPVRLAFTTAAVSVFLMIGAWLPGFLVRDELRVTSLEQGSSYFVSQGNRAALIGVGGDRPASTAKQALQSIGARELDLFLVPGTTRALTTGAAELRRDVPMRQFIDAAESERGYTRFVLWDDLTGILYLSDDNAMVLLEFSGQVLHFGGESPWR